MQVVFSTPSRLVVAHSEPAGRIRNVLLCATFILLAPVLAPPLLPSIEPLPPVVQLVSIACLIAAGAVAYHLSGCSELYTFDSERQTIVLRRISGHGHVDKTIRFDQVRDVFEETWEDNDAIKEYVVLTVDPGAKRVRLPLRLYTFSPGEREQLGALLGDLLGSQLRVVQKSS